MIRALLVFVAISSVFSQKCEDLFQNLQQDNEILNELHGTFYFILTSSETVINCEKVTWTGSGDNLQAIMQSPGCCRRVHSPIYTSNYVNFTVTPMNPLPGCPLLTTETVTFKTIAKTRTDENLCITTSACRQERQGIYEICRQQIIEDSVLDGLFKIVKNLVGNLQGLGSLPLVYNTVSQQNCVFPENNCGTLK